jgi:hypothetical protein
MQQTQAEMFRDDGIKRAVDHADKVHESWSDKAFDLLKDYVGVIGTDSECTSEMVRHYAEANGLPHPPDKRAWGAVMLKAARANILLKKGWTTATDPKVHCNPVSLWKVK